MTSLPALLARCLEDLWVIRAAGPLLQRLTTSLGYGWIRKIIADLGTGFRKARGYIIRHAAKYGCWNKLEMVPVTAGHYMSAKYMVGNKPRKCNDQVRECLLCM